MSTQRFHFMTILGRAGKDVEAAVDDLVKQRVPNNPRFGHEDFGKPARQRILQLCRALTDAADAWPVLHHATFIDGWATGSLGVMQFALPGGRNRWAIGLNDAIAYYPSKHAAFFLAEAAKAKRRAVRRRRPWWDAKYADALTTAIHAGQAFLRTPFTVAVVARCIDSSRADAHVKIATKMTIPGVMRPCKR